MVSFIEMEPGMSFPIHRHKSQQIMIVLKGGMQQRMGSQKVTLRPGDVLVIDSNATHGGEVSKKGCRAIDIFVPPREDYLRLMRKR
jgi:quercetin dioxygenase-like cupin family protein